MAKLTAKQATFVQEYLIDMNASQAGLRAGFKHLDIGRQLLTKPHVLTAIAKAQVERSERTQVTIDTVIEDLVRLGKAAEKDGQFGAALKASELLGKHLKMFTDKVELSGNQENPIIVVGAGYPTDGI